MNVFVHVCPDACELRSLDAKKIFNYVCERGYEIVDKPDDADIIFFVTCAVIQSIAEKSLNKIKEFQKYDAELIVSGCLPAIEPDGLAKVFEGKTISTKDLDEDFDKLDCFITQNKARFIKLNSANILFQNAGVPKAVGAIKKIFGKIKLIKRIYVRITDHILKKLFGENSLAYTHTTRIPIYFIKISSGCFGNCSYCAARRATGSFKSKPLDECIKEFKKGLATNYKNFSILADDTGAYGFDIKSSLPVLLDKITKIPGEYTLSIRNLNPKWVVKYIDDLEKIVKRQKITQIGIPIQSGSSRILKLMHRFPDTEKMKDAFLRLKKAHPGLVIYTHHLLGFPSETEEEFKQTLNFIKESKIDGGWVFPFSCRSDTKAESIEPKISQNEIFKRLRYAKKFLKNNDYKILATSKMHYMMFERFNRVD